MTTPAYEEPITELFETDQEDPKVIKELIDLIKKVGGVEELERQLNLQEDGASVTIKSKNDPKATTPSSIISKTLYEKIKHRASVLKTRPAFNGASQPERIPERSEKPKTTSATSTEASFVSKKYNTVNRFSRPTAQNDGIDNLPESDAILIEKPQYVSIQRRPVAKPAVVTDNDFNEDDSGEESAPVTPESRHKYATINRSRRPQVAQVVDDDDDSLEDEEEEIPTRAPVAQSTTTKPTSKYVNLSRRRSTTSTPEVER